MFIKKGKIIFTFLDALCMSAGLGLGLSSIVRLIKQRKINKQFLSRFSLEEKYSAESFYQNFSDLCLEFKITDLEIQKNLHSFLLEKLNCDFIPTVDFDKVLKISPGGSLADEGSLANQEESRYQTKYQRARKNLDKAINKFDEQLGRAVDERANVVKNAWLSPYNRFWLSAPERNKYLGELARLQAKKLFLDVLVISRTVLFAEFEFFNIIGICSSLAVFGGAYFIGMSTTFISLSTVGMWLITSLTQVSVVQNSLMMLAHFIDWERFYTTFGLSTRSVNEGYNPTASNHPVPFHSMPDEQVPRVQMGVGLEEKPVELFVNKRQLDELNSQVAASSPVLENLQNTLKNVPYIGDKLPVDPADLIEINKIENN